MNEREFEEDIEYLREMSIKMKHASQSNAELVQQLNGLSARSRDNLYNTYRGKMGAVTGIRQKVSEILRTRNIELTELEKIIAEAKKVNPRAFIRMYTAWYNILYMFLYADHKAKIDGALKYIGEAVIESLDGQDDLIFIHFDFSGERQTGSESCWFSFINKTHYSQTTARQLYLNIYNGKVEYSFYNRPARKSEGHKVLEKGTPFVFSDFIAVFQKYKEKIVEDIKNKHIKYWRIGTHGDDRNFWPDMITQGIGCIGWPELGDLNELDIKTKEDIQPLFSSEMKQENVRSRKSREVYHFYKEITEGDIIVAQVGMKVLGIGRIIGSYRYNEQSLFPHYRPVQWLIKNLEMTNEEGNQTSVHEIVKKDTIEKINKFLNSSTMAPVAAQNQENSSNSGPLNQILYGPPGTGKTFNSINKALEILGENLEEKTRKDIKVKFDKRTEEGQIIFTTFHQSMSYEDFIEGIKPLEPTHAEAPVRYKVVPGIFKRACALAAYHFYQYKKQDTAQEYSFDDLYEAFIAYVKDQIKTQQPLVYKTLRGRDIEIKEINSNGSVIARAKSSVAQSSAPLTKENLQKLYDQFQSIEDIKELRQIKEVVQIMPRITEFYAIFKGLKDFEREHFKPDVQSIQEAKEAEPLDIEAIQKKFDEGVYNPVIQKSEHEDLGKVPKVVLIIDEINRGNVSQIFGELITLIEEDKRIGKPEALELVLPYSKEQFSVPPNLYIIGTMNTADRSVEALDTALRRRFSFTEMPPDPQLITSEGKLKDQNGICEDINLSQLLRTINTRIEKLLDRDHQIGHSYFLSVGSLNDLKLAFQNKIIPLLQEYFFGDYGKIGLVLGKGFVRKKNDEGLVFAKFDDYDDSADLAERKVFELIHYEPSTDTDITFIEAIKQLINKSEQV